MDLNDLAGYSCPDSAPTTTLDRAARCELASTIRQFLNDEISAHVLDSALDSFDGSADPTVRFVAHELWHYYDDWEDHLVTLSKQEWASSREYYYCWSPIGMLSLSRSVAGGGMGTCFGAVPVLADVFTASAVGAVFPDDRDPPHRGIP